MLTKRIQQNIRSVRTVVGNNHCVIKTDDAVIGEPFQQKRTFILLRGKQNMTSHKFVCHDGPYFASFECQLTISMQTDSISCAFAGKRSADWRAFFVYRQIYWERRFQSLKSGNRCRSNTSKKSGAVNREYCVGIPFLFANC
jgi:hypothetical protein